MNILAHLDSKTWAMMPSELDRLRAVASSDMSRFDGLLKQRMLDPAAGRYSDRQAVPPTPNEAGVAVVQISGPLINVTSWLDDVMIEIFGGTSLQALQKQIDSLKSNAAITAVVFHIHSPGGEVFGTNETANKIAELSAKKPTIAYAYGCCASAAYFLAARAREIVTDKQAWLGSIGVVRTWADFTGFYEMNGVAFEEVTSKNAPYKRLDIRKPEERAIFMSEIDGLESVFHESVAKGRRVPIDTVRNSFGLGAVMAGHEAVKAGLADRVGSFDQVVKELSSKRNASSASADAEGELEMAFKEDFKKFAQSIGFRIDDAPAVSSEAAGTETEETDETAQQETTAEQAEGAAESEESTASTTEANETADAAAAAASTDHNHRQMIELAVNGFVAAELAAGRLLPAEKSRFSSLMTLLMQEDLERPLAEGSRCGMLQAMQSQRKPHGLDTEKISSESNEAFILALGQSEKTEMRKAADAQVDSYVAQVNPKRNLEAVK